MPPTRIDISNSIVNSILETIKSLNRHNDIDTILDRILYEARKISNADAGSIYLINRNRLEFSFVHNNTLFKNSTASLELYKSYSMPIDRHSIVGYVALTGEMLVIEDAYQLPKSLPYSFNISYDKRTGYRTKSIMTIPLITFNNKLVGVMQLINSKDEDGRSVPFSIQSQTYVPLFANNASVAIEQGIKNREIILRMVKMAELRDPSETGAHVQRVGAYSAEIYQQYALNKNTDWKELKHKKDLIRIAAMLHDVGKVGISDVILKKPSRLTNEEYDSMKWHTIFGTRLFSNQLSELDIMSRDIVLNHHEKWNAKGGYPGHVEEPLGENVAMSAPKKREEIPLAARITALADVFDALVSRRVYKDPWPDDRVLATIQRESGRHFDPEVVAAFFEIFDVIKAIRKHYED